MTSRWEIFWGVVVILAMAIYLPLLITWSLLQTFPGTPVAHAFLYACIGSAINTVLWSPEHGYHYRRKIGLAATATSFTLTTLLTWWLWDVGMALERVSGEFRQHLGQTLGVGGDNGFQALFMGTVAIFLALWALIAALVYKPTS